MALLERPPGSKAKTHKTACTCKRHNETRLMKSVKIASAKKEDCTPKPSANNPNRGERAANNRRINKPLRLRAYPIRPVALQVMMLHARCSMPM